MSERETIRRLRAWHEGRPLPCGSTLHFHVANDTDLLVVSFLRMGGESRPWGIAWGHPGEAPAVRTVPDGRNRDLVAAMAADLAVDLLEHLRIPGFARWDPDGHEDLLPLRQVWLPNDAHLDMVHHLGFAYAYTTWGEERRDLLNAFGRACGWLFREAQRPGQQAVFPATTALRSAFTFPAETIRQGHLGFLLAWLTAEGDRDAHLAAATEAEQRPISPSLAPELERRDLQPLVERWGEADKEGHTDTAKEAADEIDHLLADELRYRWQLTCDAIEVLRSDTRRTNAGVADLVKATADELWKQHVRHELRLADPTDGPPYFASIETDRHPAAAGSRYLVQQASADFVDGLLLHDDAELLAEAIERGDGFRGEIVLVDDLGEGKRTRPIWVVRDTADRQLRLRVGSTVCVLGFRKREGRVRSLSEDSDGSLLVEVEITKLKTAHRDGTGPQALAPNDSALEGESVTLVSAPADGISRTKAGKIWTKTGPGAWLTHANPGGATARVDDEDADDVAEITAATS